MSRQLWPVALMLLAACEKAGGVMLIDGGIDYAEAAVQYRLCASCAVGDSDPRGRGHDRRWPMSDKTLLAVAGSAIVRKRSAVAEAEAALRESGVEFGVHLRACREAAGVSLRDVAQLVRCSAMHLCDIEHGRRTPSDTLMAKIVVTFS